MTEPRSTAPACVATPPRLDHFLQISSRTFALTIPLLHEPTRCEVTVAYLLFRVADSFEDSTRWPREKKLDQLGRLACFLENPSIGAAETLAADWVENPPLLHVGYLELLAGFPAVMRAAASISPEAWHLVSTHTGRTCRAMSSFVARERDGVLKLTDMEDLRAYCYAVAGIVGEMLTELFLLSSDSLQCIAPCMRAESASFGEGLQLVNILRDRATDAGEGRYYLPRVLSPTRVFALARRDLATAARYCARLEQAGSDRGIVAFTALPVLLARATLDRVDQDGPGAKLSRSAVTTMVAQLHDALNRGAVGALFEQAEEESPRREDYESPSAPR